MRRLFMATMLVSLIASPARAGGSVIEPYQDGYRPGETVTMRGDVGRGQLGWLEDGPFYAYLRVDPETARRESPDRFPHIHETDVPLGELGLNHLGPGWVHVFITFRLPADLAPGVYNIVYCNDPCTEGLGDLIGGWVEVTVAAEAPPRWPVRPGVMRPV